MYCDRKQWNPETFPFCARYAAVPPAPVIITVGAGIVKDKASAAGTTIVGLLVVLIVGAGIASASASAAGITIVGFFVVVKVGAGIASASASAAGVTVLSNAGVRAIIADPR